MAKVYVIESGDRDYDSYPVPVAAAMSFDLAVSHARTLVEKGVAVRLDKLRTWKDRGGVGEHSANVVAWMNNPAAQVVGPAVLNEQQTEWHGFRVWNVTTIGSASFCFEYSRLSIVEIELLA